MRFTRLIAAAVLVGVGVSAMAQFGGQERPASNDGKIMRRIKIRHADPYLIMLLLSGTQGTDLAPETSTILNSGGNGGFGGRNNWGGGSGNGNGNRGLGGGSGNGNNFGNRSGGGNNNRGRGHGGGF